MSSHPITVTLDEPIVRGDTKVTSVDLRKPRAIELGGVSLYDLQRMETAAVLQVLPRITEPALTDVEAALLPASDLFAMATEIAGFLWLRGAGTASPEA